jgi:hypothetical protein
MMIKLTVKRRGSTSDWGRKLARSNHQIDCPKCKRPITLKLGELRPSGSAKCGSCGANVVFEGDDIVAKAEQAVEDFSRQLEKIFR